MEIKIRKMMPGDKLYIISMMREFYSSDAVFTNGSEEIFENDFENCINENPYIEGFTFCNKEEIAGYSMIAKSFSTEFGKQCIWLEDIYLKPDYRGKGTVPKFIKYIKHLYPETILRLEAEHENTRAMHVYKKLGFKELPYVEMKME